MKHCFFGVGIVITLLFIIVGLCATVPVYGATIQFGDSSKSFTGAQVRSDWSFIGITGDFFEIADGKRQITLVGPRGYTFGFTVTVSGTKITVSDSYSEAPNCEPALKVTWKEPAVNVHQSVQNAFCILLQEPIFGSSTGISSCTAASMAGCTKQKIIMEASSDPSGAEIWINGEKLPNKTNITLSVPYCEYESTKNVVLRLQNSINCSRSFDLSPDAKVNVSCNLEALQKK